MKKKNVQALLVGMSVMMSVILPVTPALAADSSHAEKEQTVYVNADENGNSKEVIVSNWLKNTGDVYKRQFRKMSDKLLQKRNRLRGRGTYALYHKPGRGLPPP